MGRTSRITKKVLQGLVSGLVFLAVAVALGEVAEVGAVTLNPGDILVADQNAFGGSGGVIHVNPGTGVQTIVSSGGLFVNPRALAIAANGDVLVSDHLAVGGPAIIRVNPATGVQTIVSSGGLFVEPFGIAIASNGDILVANANAPGGANAVIRVDPVTGAQTTVSSGGLFVSPSGIAIAPNGDILVVDTHAFGGPAPDFGGPCGGFGCGAVIRVDPLTGAQTPVSSGGNFFNPSGIAIAANGDLLVTESSGVGGAVGVIRVDPVTGAQTPVSSGGSFVGPAGIAIAANGDLLVTDVHAFGGGCPVGCGGIIRIDPGTGVQTMVSSNQSFFDPTDIALVPGPLSVAIDIKPGSFPNSINPRSPGGSRWLS